MTMSAHIFHFERWYRDKQLDGWTADFDLLVVDGTTVLELNGGSQYWEQQAKEQYPDHVWHDKPCLSLHRGKLEHNKDMLKLMFDYPEVYEVLGQKFVMGEPR